MEELIRQFTDRYLTREEIAYRLPVSLPISEFWPVIDRARRDISIELPLKTQDGEYFRFVMNSSITEQCNAVASMARKSYLLDTLPPEIMEDATIDEAVWSSVIEGAFTSRAEAAKIIRQDKAPANRSEQMIKNNYRAMLYVLEHLEEPISAKTLTDIAKLVTDNASDEPVRGFRTVQVYVTGREGVVYTPPSAEQVPRLMNDLLDFIQNSDLHPLFKACIAHFYFVYVHPFTDGNGRTARALSYMMLLRSGYDFFRFFSVSGIIAEERNRYYKSMRNVEASGDDMTYFIDYYSAMLARSTDKIEKQLIRHVLTENILSGLEKEQKLNDRQMKGARWLLENAFDHVTVDAWKKKFRTATETARLDLLQLCDAGILERKMDGRKAVFKLQMDRLQ